jgi:glycosyltransferase involved in cell wall biosynthesis
MSAGHSGERGAPLWVVVPAGIDDPATPSGGNRYDRRVIDELGRVRPVHEIVLDGRWPRPGDPSLADRLAELPDGAHVLLDGLVACGVPELIEPSAGRLRMTVLVHLSLADETGLSDGQVTELTGYERRTVDAAIAVVTTSAGAAQRLIDRHGLAPQKVHVAAPGVDAAPLNSEAREGRRLGCVAAVIPRKGQDVLVAALGLLDDLDWDCVCVGALDRDPEFVRSVRSGRRVRFVGTRAGAALSQAYEGMDLLILPSRAETYGMVVTEALARGIPVLGTRVDGVPEALGHASDGSRPGLLVPADDPAALAGALRRWLTDGELRRRLRAAAADRREGLRSWTDTAQDLTRAFA